MSVALDEKRNRRLEAGRRMKEILDSAKRSDRGMTAEEEQEFDRLGTEHDRLSAEIRNYETYGDGATIGRLRNESRSSSPPTASGCGRRPLTRFKARATWSRTSPGRSPTGRTTRRSTRSAPMSGASWRASRFSTSSRGGGMVATRRIPIRFEDYLAQRNTGLAEPGHPGGRCTGCLEDKSISRDGYCRACLMYAFGYDQAEEKVTQAILGGAVTGALTSAIEVSPEIIALAVHRAMQEARDGEVVAMYEALTRARRS